LSFKFLLILRYYHIFCICFACPLVCVFACVLSLVAVAEYMLPLEGPREDDAQSTLGNYQLELVEKIDGKNDAVGDASTALIHRLL
jgi:hypothetical protein